MFASPPSPAPSQSITPLDVEHLVKARHSAEFLQSDLGYFHGSQSPLLAELIRRELDVVNGVADRLALLTAIVRAD
jgi:hypothetical protein